MYKQNLMISALGQKSWASKLTHLTLIVFLYRIKKSSFFIMGQLACVRIVYDFLHGFLIVLKTVHYQKLMIS